jgi:Zn-dependent membrane protease YugP
MSMRKVNNQARIIYRVKNVGSGSGGSSGVGHAIQQQQQNGMQNMQQFSNGINGHIMGMGDGSSM